MPQSKKTDIKSTIPLLFTIKAVHEDDDEEKGIVTGHAAAFSLDQGLDEIKRGAFKKTIKEHKKNGIWPVLKQHDTDQKIGINLEASEDDFGLLIKEELNLETQGGREQFALTKQFLRHGGDDGLSIGFIPIKFKFEEREFGEGKSKLTRMVRILNEIRMFEHSHVTFGMNEDALTAVAKAALFNDNGLTLGDEVDNFFRHMEYIGHKSNDVLEALNAHGKSQKSDPDLLQSANRIIALLKT